MPRLKQIKRNCPDCGEPLGTESIGGITYDDWGVRRRTPNETYFVCPSCGAEFVCRQGEMCQRETEPELTSIIK